MGESSCVTCGECVAACPTGALINKPIHDVPIRPREELKSVDSVCPYCGVGCALTYHVDEERNAIVVRRGPRAAGQPQPAVREGPLRVRLRRIPQRLTVPLIRREELLPEGRALGRRQGRGRAAGASPAAWSTTTRSCRTSARRAGRRRSTSRRRRLKQSTRARPGRDRGLRLGEVLQRGGLPLPEADPRGLRHEQRRPLHAPLPRLERRRAVRGRRLGRGLDDLRRHHQRRRRDHGGHEHDGEPPGRVLVLQAGAAARDEADRRRPAARADRRPRRHLLPDQAGHRRGVLQRRHARDHPPRAGRPRVHRRARRRTTASWPRRSRTTRPSGRRRSAASTPTRSARSRGSGARPSAASHLLGHGHLPAHDRHGQRALPDRPVLDHRPRRPARHRACTRCAGRTTSRAPPTRA